MLGGCVVTDASLAYAAAYNKVSIDGIIHHFGRDVFKETAQVAEAEWNRDHPQKVANTTQ